MDADDHPFMQNAPAPPDHSRDWQAWIMIVGFGQFFLFFLVFSVTWGDQKMISDNLLHPSMGYYVGLMTFFVVFQCLVCGGYFAYFRKKDLAICVVGWGFVLHSLAGWLVLAFNADSAVHFTGVVLYLLGLGGTYVLLLRLSKHYDARLESETYDVIAGTLFLCTVSFLVAFVVLFFLDHPDAWLWENLAFLFYLLYYLYFFANHPHDPSAPIVNEKPYTEVPLCRPLIIIKRS